MRLRPCILNSFSTKGAHANIFVQLAIGVVLVVSMGAIDPALADDHAVAWTGDHSLMLGDGPEILLENIEMIEASMDITGISEVKFYGNPDRYGRQPGALWDESGQDLGLRLLQEGKARLHPRLGERDIPSEWIEAELAARQAKKGAFAQARFRTLSTLEASSRQYVGTYQTLEGLVVKISVSARRFDIRLDGGMRVQIFLDDSPFSKEEVKQLTEKKLLIRGWIENDGLVKIGRKEQIIILK